MSKLLIGILAGFLATLIISLLMLAKDTAGIMPQLDVIRMLSVMMSAPLAMLNMAQLMGWLAHFIIGSAAWGTVYALVEHRLPGQSPVRKGLAFAGVAWLAMMVIMMPLLGVGLFAARLGVMASLTTLLLHLVYGATLGLFYGRFARSRSRAIVTE